MRLLLVGILFISLGINTGAQDIPIEDRVYRDDIKSVKIYRPEWNLSYPLITLNSNETLLLQFDLLGSDIETYYYTFIHCDKDWNESEIYPVDYLDGFSENQVDEYEMSFNTTVNYIHYSLSFPNNDIKFKYSGNYIVKVYPIGDPEKAVFTKRFMVSENSASIKAIPQRPKIASEYNTGQQIDFEVDYSGLRITDPYRSSFASILQNGRWDISSTNMKPDFLRDNSLVFNGLSEKNIFKGASEFRYFDIKSLRYHSEYIKAIEHEIGNYHVYLMHSEDRSARQYFYNQDFNGKYYTAIQEGRDHEVEADYVYVYFTLPSRFPVKNGDVYILGALSDWDMNELNRMRYNSNTNSYEATMLLKQGWYNYVYAVKNNDGMINKESTFENNHFETENDYLILIYLREPMERYDRLIGSKVTNTLIRQN
jgi:hypothetical protein